MPRRRPPARRRRAPRARPATSPRRDEPLGQAAESRAQELQRSLDRRCENGREREAREVERGRERLRVEVADRDEASLRGHDQRIPLVRVQLDDDLALDEPQRVASRAVHLRHAPERQRILEEASCSGLPERAPVEQRVEPRERLAEAVRAPRDRDLGMQRADVAAERLEVERSRRVDPAHERARVGDRERGLSRRERVPVEEGERLARLERRVRRARRGRGRRSVRGRTDRPCRAS